MATALHLLNLLSKKWMSPPTIQFLLTRSQFLLDGGLFDFNRQVLSERRIVTQEILEKALEAKPGSFNFMTSS